MNDFAGIPPHAPRFLYPQHLSGKTGVSYRCIMKGIKNGAIASDTEGRGSLDDAYAWAGRIRAQAAQDRAFAQAENRRNEFVPRWEVEQMIRETVRDALAERR